jgi:hypothetical protein
MGCYSQGMDITIAIRSKQLPNLPNIQALGDISNC